MEMLGHQVSILSCFHAVTSKRQRIHAGHVSLASMQKTVKIKRLKQLVAVDVLEFQAEAAARCSLNG
jgi:hypothetical protein